MPTTFALGVRDPIVHPDQTPALKRLKPDLDLVRIVGLSADHFLLVGLPDTVANEIMRDEIKTLNVRYRAGTPNEAPIVFLHGIQDDPRFWLPIAQSLSRRHEVAVVDLLGFGDSPKPMSAKYTLEEHVTALAHTIVAQFPREEARLVGHGFGATVALGVAASVPERVCEVVAFSPLLFSDGGLGTDCEVSEDDRDVASAMSIADSLNEMARDERGSAAAERFEDRLEPIVRTFKNAVGNLRTEDLLRRVADPVRFIAPVDDDRVPVKLIAARVAERDDFSLETPAGTRELPLEDPAAAVLMLDPEAHEEARIAAGLPRPKPRAGLRALREVFESATSTIFWRGLWTFFGGLVILLWPGFPAGLVTFAFAIWVAVLGVQTIVGAVGLRRTGKGGWIPWLLLGALAAAIAVFLLIQPDWSMFIIAAVIFVRALYTGIVDIYIARKVAHGPTPKWLLWLEGVVGLAIAAFLLFGSNHGIEITKLAVGIYFVVTGFTSLAYAVEVQRRTRKRTRAMLDDHGVLIRSGGASAPPAAGA
jgi:pimeloyl-ACP methyl ester carboxylesterase